MRLSLPGKVFAAFAVLLFTFGGVTAYSVFQVRQIGHDVGQLHATLLPLPAVVAGLNRDLQGLELLLEQTDPGALRRAVHLARRVRPYLEQLEAGFQRLDEGLAQSEAARSTWQELGALAGARGELGTELTRFFDAVDSGSEPEEARRAARQHLRVLRRGLGRIEREIGALIDQQVGAFAEEEAQVVWGAILLGAVSMIIGVAVTWLTGRLLRPLQILRAGVERVARGEYDQPVHVSGRGELSALAADFNRMAEAIRGRDAQLVAQQTELLHQERLATVGRMSAQITHELRNPLSSIGLNSELLLDDLEEEHPGRPLLVSIIREVERLREITEEYLRFARLPRPELRAVDLNHACEELAEFVRGEMEQAGVRLRVDADRAGRAARVDPNQLRAALLNLVRNAREAIGERGGHVVLRVRTLGEQVSVAVVDDGPGLSPAAREHLFEPFFSTRPQGTGLGLPMVRLILQAQQGRVDIDDTPGGGTTVTLVLPAAQPEDAPMTTWTATLWTYNIRVGVESSLDALAAAVRAHGAPDLIALQEVGVRWQMGERVDQPATLAAAVGLDYHAFAGALLDGNGGRFGVALLSRWPLDGVQTTNLPRAEDEQRVILRARVLAPVPFVALVTHLSVKPAERLAQAEVLGGAVAVEAGPVVLLGDLNDVPGSPTLAAAEAGLVDCFDAAGEGEPVTFSVRAPQVRIDYIACGGGLAPAGPARVVRGATASDHFPLEAVVGPG